MLFLCHANVARLCCPFLLLPCLSLGGYSNDFVCRNLGSWDVRVASGGIIIGPGCVHGPQWMKLTQSQSLVCLGLGGGWRISKTTR